MIFGNGFRHDTEALLRKSDVRKQVKLNHTPIVVFVGDNIELCFNLKDFVMNYAPETVAMVQWKGKWRSDFFTISVQEVKDFILDNPPMDSDVI